MQFIAETVEVLGGQKLFKRPVRSANDLDQAVSAGLPAEALTSAANSIGYMGQSAPSISMRIVPPSTWKRRVRSGQLSPDESDKLVRFAHVVAVARHVLGAGEIVGRFFQTPHPELAGRKPADAAMSEIGARQVEDILWRIFYGLPA